MQKKKPESSPGIYAIRNKVNGKIYVGSSKNMRTRWNQHFSELSRNLHRNPRLQNSWNVHGEENFEFLVIEFVGAVEDLVVREQYWIDSYDASSRDNYNILPIAGSTRGHTYTEDQRKAMSIRSTGRKHTPESIAKMSAAKKGTKMSEEAKAILSALYKGKPVSEEIKKKMSDGQKLVNQDPEVKERKRLGAMKRKPRTAESRARMSEIMKGKNCKHRTPEEEAELKEKRRSHANEYARARRAAAKSEEIQV
jgi:group I intron endonuclease